MKSLADIQAEYVPSAVVNTAIAKYLLRHELFRTLSCFAAEAKLRGAENLGNFMALRQHLDRHDFVSAIELVQQVMNTAVGDPHKPASSPGLLPSFEDLIYVLSKYLLIQLHQTQQHAAAADALEQVIAPLVKKEQRRGGVRAEWFATDLQLLRDLVHSSSTSSSNIYHAFNWKSEIFKFWESAKAALKLQEIERDRDNSRDPRKGRPRSRSGSSTPPPPLFAFALARHFFADDSWLSSALELDQMSSDAERWKRAASIISTASSDKLRVLPPLPPDLHETSDFALAAVCGPSISQARVLDVRDMPESGQVIVATAGGDDRNDKGISLWEMRSGSLLSHLDNGTIKQVVAILFHPSFPELLLTADMEFDVKLWNWREGRVVRWWRKHHTRIIFRLAWIPGDETRAASCSGDQSLKFWNIHAEKPQSSSIHANEPITSFAFSGSTSDPMQQKVIVSLSYTIRVYKVRTLTMIITIPMNDLKLSKTPITNLASHPVFDTFILVSADNQLRLFDLTKQAFVKSYSARLIESGTRIRGEFSPCGAFVYATASDVRQTTSRRLPAAASFGHDPSGHTHGGSTGEVAPGIFLWRLHTGKLEQAEMSAMDATDGWDHNGDAVRPCPMVVCKWVMIRGKSTKAGPAERKAMVAAGHDKLVRLYL
ncbi:hypothetical protein HK105_201929 [Polyrhizophydium stewartii]|uniref:Uncharacterized protein n=1 Tax=Polyrhizophydium stewartii TaxID=2732419 RepID=A0ABR4NG82_9FUNG